MNDPELDEPLEQAIESTQRDISTHAEKSDHEDPHGVRAQIAHDRNHTDHFLLKRWWFTSTAFPLLAGTFGPLANLMSVCALVQTWRVKFKSNGEEGNSERVPDPTWLLALNGVSLVFAVAANVLLLLNFAQRVRYRVAQPITVCFWYIAAIILIVLVIVSSQILPLENSEYAFSQSFYYGIISSALYFIIATLLTLNNLGSLYWNAYPASLETLTMPQRTVMLQTTLYAFYLALGAGIFSSIENWSFVDGIYFAHYSLLTIGLGSDFPLSRNLARILLIPYAFLGIITLGLIISSIRSLFLARAKQEVRLRALDQKGSRLRKRRNESPEHNFNLMRQTEDSADRFRKLWKLSISTTVTAGLWLLGAMVFYYTERHRPQGWSYWDALYFSYTTLLTLGYGDFYPFSMAGKPFFVIWTMIAVPTMTIFISTMGDTVVGWVKSGTVWISRRTILPERALKPDGEESVDSDDNDFQGKSGEADAAALAREISRVGKDVGSESPKKYPWKTWEKWLRMLGISEDEAEWSWLGDGGPLMSTKTEAEWILEKLCERLQVVLEKGNDKNDRS